MKLSSCHIREFERNFYHDPWDGRQLMALRIDPWPGAVFVGEHEPMLPVAVKYIWRVIFG